MGGSPILPSVVNFLSSRPGELITLQRLANELQLEAVKVQKALSNMLRDGGYGESIETVHRGQVWRWVGGGVARLSPLPVSPEPPTAAPAVFPAPAPVLKSLRKGDMVEVMGVTQDGDAVASDENGRLYRVVPL